ncbi:hypothetical protein Lepto7375DRAFT_1772 [Leptolyngbya sp. PCC 7375]|nr:hypothetical protein Lepto7375DRAFT_1772 [Leptolyngbya sp. PCC 7375]
MFYGSNMRKTLACLATSIFVGGLTLPRTVAATNSLQNGVRFSTVEASQYLQPCVSRLQILRSRLSDLQLQRQFLAHQEMHLANTVGALFTQLSHLSPNSSQYRAIQRQIAEARELMASIRNQKIQVGTQISAVEAQINALNCS